MQAKCIDLAIMGFDNRQLQNNVGIKWVHRPGGDEKSIEQL